MNGRSRTASILVLVAVCGALALGWRQFRLTTLSDTELQLRHPSGYTLLTPADYKVLSSFLGAQDEVRVGFRRGESIIAPLTTTFKSPMADRQWMKSQLLELRDDTLAQFDRCSRQSAVVAPQFSISSPYKIGTFEEVGDLDRLYARYPQANGFVEFSCVAYSADSSQALFWVERHGKDDAALGMFVLMIKNNSGQWAIANEMICFVA